jgi:hypothetical protein
MVRASDWLVSQIDIIAHIFFATGTVDRVVVSSRRGDMLGTMCYPDDQGILIRTDAAVPSVSPGDSVSVQYSGPGDTYQFYSAVVAVDGSGIRVQIPLAIERNDRRLTIRYTVEGRPGFGLRASLRPGRPVYSLVDISHGGICAMVPNPPQIMEMFRGHLLLPDEEPIPVGIEVRDNRARDGVRLMRGRFRSIETMDHARLGRYLVKLAKLLEREEQQRMAVRGAL